jgi:preprotein translocase subunit SecG
MVLLAILTTVHVIVCFFLVIVVLLQSGKAADLAGAFGGMGSQTAFGPRGAATVLSKATTAAAILFMVTSLSLSILASRRGSTTGVKSVLDQNLPKQSAPAQQPVTTPQPVQGLPPGAVAPGQPSVTLTPEAGGPSRTIPLELPPPPGQQKQAPPAKK